MPINKIDLSPKNPMPEDLRKSVSDAGALYDFVGCAKELCTGELKEKIEESGIDVKKVLKILGHKTPQETLGAIPLITEEPTPTEEPDDMTSTPNNLDESSPTATPTPMPEPSSISFPTGEPAVAAAQ